MNLIVIILYLLAAIVCGALGRRTSFGFLGHFILAIVLTPIGDFLIQLVARPSKEVRDKVRDLEDS